MAVIKCKMCGGDLDISEGLSVCECEYCGTKQTVPTADNEKKLTLFARANRLRLANEFDKAAGVYETIVADFPDMTVIGVYPSRPPGCIVSVCVTFIVLPLALTKICAKPCMSLPLMSYV